MGSGSSLPSNVMKEVTFAINEKSYTVSASASNGITPETTLNTFIRDHAKLKGTKNMCLEGGCGSCIVSVHSKHPVTKRDVYFAVNSCLVTIFSCSGWRVTTVEGLGDRSVGYSATQSRLAEFNGTQCGFCSPGMVMNMHALCARDGVENLTMADVENSFGGNVCRCTGYRPIADAFKSMCGDADPTLTSRCADVEDIVVGVTKCWRNTTENGRASSARDDSADDVPRFVGIDFGSSKWFKVFNIAELLEVLHSSSGAKYMLVAGNTGHGVYRRPDNIEVYVDVSSVADLRSFKMDGPTLTLGANMTLTETMQLFRKLAGEHAEFEHLAEMADHIDLVANVPVRNIGTIAGNLSLKHAHREFPSDVFLILETFGAQLITVTSSGVEATVSLREYLDSDMTGKIVKSVALPRMDGENLYRTYKIMPRAQNAHAYVNAGFHLKMDKGVVSSASIVYGGISPDFVHAVDAEKYIVGKDPFDDAVLQAVYKILDAELKPDHVLPDATPLFRKQLAVALFYKFILSVAPATKVSKSHRSGGPRLVRPVSTASQDFQTDKTQWPLQKPVPKIEAVAQCSGEAIYVNDIYHSDDDLHASFVLARAVPGSKVVGQDPAEALKVPGVVRYINHKDIPGTNRFSVPDIGMLSTEVIFCEDRVLYNGQPIGLIVATTRDVAIKASKLVDIKYDPPTEKPVFDIRAAIADNDSKRIRLERKIDAKTRGNDVKKVIRGKFDIGHQYHYTMETQSCVCIPSEDSLDVYASTQNMSASQMAIASALNIPVSKINCQVRRLGGAYGAKISRAQQISTSCAIASFLTNRPVHLQMTMEDNVDAIGKRFPCSADYEVGVDDNGKVQYLKISVYENYGYTTNEALVVATCLHLPNGYVTDTWDIKGYGVFTDIHANTFCRSPSSTEGIAMAESIMDHIAHELNVDPLKVRLQNIEPNKVPMTELIPEFRKSVDYDKRRAAIEEFNKNNRWRKKGIHMALMDYPFFYYGNFHVLVSIYTPDGTVAVTHGGIECGQGINTKVAQVTAHMFGIDLDMVSVKPSSTITAPNNDSTGGSVTSESVCYAVIQACNTLKERLKQFAKVNLAWKDIVRAAAVEKVDLCATHMFTLRDNVRPYPIYGLCTSEIELDLLTGNYQITRVDILEDTGESMSPIIDVGQIEGAFVMGLGYWMMEKVVAGPNDGAILTGRTWNYKVPGMKDIPIDFRVKFRRNAKNPDGVLNSKATAEPPLCLSIGVALAVRQALASARNDSQPNADRWCAINGPSTTEDILLNSLLNYKDFKL